MQVIKRTNEVVNFDMNKIANAINKAFNAEQKEISDYALNKLLVMISSRISEKAVNNKITVEEIQDIIEKVLAESGYFEIAKAYMKYRWKHENVRVVNKHIIDYSCLMNNYLDKLDWRVKENSTVQYTLGGLILSNSGAVTANYWLNSIYDKDIADAHKNCYMHIHDLSMLSGYCAGWNLKQLIKEGIRGVEGRISSSPARHLNTLCNQMVNFLGIMQNEWAGAQAFSSFDTYLAPYVKADNLSYKEVKQAIQSFVFGVNIPSRWGTQAPFSNITLDWDCPMDQAHLPALVGDEEMPFTYGDCQKEMDMINKAFLEIMNEGDADGRGFQYPIPTYSITRDFNWNYTENNKLLFDMTSKYGTPYFSNYINSDMNPSDCRSMCCRLRLDLRDLRKRNGGFFGAGESTGSIGVVTLNLPRIAYTSETEEIFWEKLDYYTDLAARSLKVKREVITNLLNNNLYPYTKAYLGTFANHFSTIGIIGGNEMCLNAKWLGKDLTDKKSQDFVEKLLIHLRNKLSDYQEKYAPDLYNLEATPAEGTTYRFAQHDKEDYPNIITANNEDGTEPYYTNSTNLPVNATTDVFEALEIQDKFQPKYTSGTVFHTFLGEQLPDWKSSAGLVKKMCDNFKIPYISISPTYSICSEHGYIAGEHFTCPKCKKETEVYSRITGYYRPIKNWNEGKTQEYKDRTEYVQDIKAISKENAIKLSKNTECKKVEKCVLYTTPTCPNCVVVKNHLTKKNMEYSEINITEHMDIARKYKILTAPTLQIGDKLYRGIEEIMTKIN